MAKGLIGLERKRGEATGEFGKAAMRVAKKASAKYKSYKQSRREKQMSKAAWIRKRYGSVLTKGEAKAAEASWKLYMDKEKFRATRVKRAKAKGAKLAAPKGRKPRKNRATYKSAKF